MKKPLITKLKKSPFDSTYAKSNGISGRMLSYFVKQGMLTRLAHGVYAFPEKMSIEFEDILKEKIIQAPQAVIGLRTALRIYDLTEYAPSHIDLLVPESNIPKKKMQDVKLHSVKDHLFNEGVTKIRGIPVTNIERTIIDILRKTGTQREGRDIIMDAQRKAFKISFSELERLATQFRIKHKFTSIVENL